MVLAAGYEKSNVIMVACAEWHAGIVGIVAGRLVERFNRPSFVMTIDEESGTCKGSARSIPRFHLAEAIWAHPELISGGGHAMAAGCHFPLERLDEVRNALDRYAAERLTPSDFRPVVTIDMATEAFELNLSAVEALALLEPFGLGNPEPLMIARNMCLSQVRPTRDPRHARLVLRTESSSPVSGIAFGIGEFLAELTPGCQLDVLFKPEINEFRGTRELQWQVKDFRLAEAQVSVSEVNV
jgi:single-stranded-DNA-specific exonuclease